MSWFKEQVKQRKETEDEMLENAFSGIAGAVIGKKLESTLQKQEICKSAIEEVLKYFNLKLKKNYDVNNISIDEQINMYMKPYGIMHREVILTDKWYQDAFGPMLGTINDKVIALIPSRTGGYKYFDFVNNKYIKVTRNNYQEVDKEATVFYKPLPQKQLTILDLVKYMVSLLSTPDIVLYFVMMLISTLIGLVSPVLTKILFSYVIESQSVQVLLAIAVFMICHMLCQLMFGAFQSLINTRIATKQDIIVQAAIMNRIMSLKPTFFKDYSSGELASRSQYVQRLCNLFMSTLGMTGITSIFSLVYIAQIFAFAPALVVPSLIITILTIVISLTTTFVQMKFSKKQMLNSTKESGMSYAMITGIQKIKLAGAENRFFSRWAKLYAKSVYLENNPPKLVKYSSVISTSISLIGTLVMYYFALANKVSIADYYAFNASYAMVSGAFQAVAGIAIKVADIRPTLEMAKPILEAEVENNENGEFIKELKGNIELSNVSFRYDDNMPMVIDDLSLKINSGEYVAVVGYTGCGKSTLLRLLLGFEKPLRGSIYYDGKDISRVDLQSLRRKIGVVMQNGKLFQGDIYSNIVISAPQLSIDDAWCAAKIASIDEDIKQMPMGMHTLISEGQGGISGGQKQRLMIARAVAPKPKVLMFDEATSALDNITQKHVSEAIDGLNCTRIVIAHRLSTIKHCDRIIVLDKGKIIEDGTYEELINKNGFFASLVERQRLDIED